MNSGSSKRGPYGKTMWLVSLDERQHGCSKALDDSSCLEHKGERQRRNIARNKIMKDNLGHERIKTSL